MKATVPGKVLTNAYQQDLAAYWNNKTQDSVNLRLGDVDGWELHRLETAQADVLLDHLGPIGKRDRLLDGGSGRGGTSFMAYDRFGCRVDGVTISEYQVGFATEQAEIRGCAGEVEFHFRNMLDTGFPTGSMAGIWTNETTMYGRPGPALRRVLQAAPRRRSLRVHNRLLQRHSWRAVRIGPGHRLALPVRDPPAQRLLPRTHPERPRTDHRRRPDPAGDPVLGAPRDIVGPDRNRGAVPHRVLY